MQATVIISMDNAAFSDLPGFELARILRRVAGHLEHVTTEECEGFYTALVDANGNNVGQLTIED